LPCNIFEIRALVHYSPPKWKAKIILFLKFLPLVCFIADFTPLVTTRQGRFIFNLTDNQATYLVSFVHAWEPENRPHLAIISIKSVCFRPKADGFGFPLLAASDCLPMAAFLPKSDIKHKDYSCAPPIAETPSSKPRILPAAILPVAI